MSTDLKEQLAAAVADLGLVVKPICEVQRLYNEHKKYLSGKVLKNPLEEVHLLDENFPYWIKLENDDPSRPGTWIGSKASIVVPKLETGEFDDKGFTFVSPAARRGFCCQWANSWPLTLLAYHSRPLAGRILSRLRSRAIARNVFPWLRHSTMSVNTSGSGRWA
jgi:hypothetical protein